MALTAFQRRLCRLIAQNRTATGESYFAGGASLNELIGAPRVSRDLDVFHDTEHAVSAGWDADRRVLEAHGMRIRVLRERPAYVEAEVSVDGEAVRMEWARDSAYRFFPLMPHAELGLVLHPFDLATNKVLALVGRVEVRDWVDAIHSAERVQPIGYLAWAASGKDPGFSPASILEEAVRTARYSTEEVTELAYEAAPPDAADLSRRWKHIITAGRRVVKALPAGSMGSCVLSRSGELFTGDAEAIAPAIEADEIRFHRGRLRGAFPQLLE